jgi:regulator of RNase E activity RraB
MRWLRSLFSRQAPDVAVEPAEPLAVAPVIGWDSWRAQAPEGPVAVALDLALEPRVPDPARPLLARVSYPLRAPGPDGLPTAAEGEALARVEDELSGALAAIGAAYAGRVTMAGTRQHLFYLAGDGAVAEALAAAAPGLAGYEVTLHGEDDPAWTGWTAELSPPPRARRWMEDRRAVEALARHGASPELARPVDHQASFPTPEAREAFATEAVARGFELAARRDDAPPPAPFAIDLRRDDQVTLRHIHGVSWSLCELAARHGGGYDGWEPGS